MSRDFPVKGLAELDRYLSALPKAMQTGAYRAGLTAAAAVIRDEARVRAPKKSGKMAKAIKSGSARKNQDGSFSITVRLDPRGNNHAFLGLFHEYGVAPHAITRRDDKLLAKVRKARAAGGRSDVLDDIEGRASKSVFKIGDEFVSGTINHPGHRAQPFMRPALDAKADEAVEAFARRIRDYLEGKTGFVAPLEEAA